MERHASPVSAKSPYEAQLAADRIRLLRQELSSPELQRILDLTSEQQRRFDEWTQAQIAELARNFDVNGSVSQKRMPRGKRIASTLGGIALCAAVVLFLMLHWGDLATWLQW